MNSGTVSIHLTQPANPLPRAALIRRLETSFAALESSRSSWDECVIRLGGSIYMSFDWCRTWWEFYGDARELRIFLFYSDDNLVGIVPFYIDSLRFGPWRFRVARLVGANIPPKAFNAPIHIQYAESIFEQILVQLIQRDGCDALSFGPVSDLQQSRGILETVCAKRRDIVLPAKVSADVHSSFSLPATMEDYYQSLSKNERKNRRKYELRLLKKEYDTRVDIISEPQEACKEFECFVEQHARQWQAEGKTGHFGAWPRALEFNRALLAAQAPLGRARFIRILANGEVIANQYTYAFGDTYYWELPARAVGGPWERFSLGPTGIVTMIDAGIQEKKARLEGGLTHYDYKVRLGAEEFAVRTVRVVADRWRSRLGQIFFNAIRFCFHYAYHRIWYRRVVPHLPSGLKRPQWMFWLRLDF